MAGSKIPTAADLRQVVPQGLPGFSVPNIGGDTGSALSDLGQAGGAAAIVVRDRAEATEAQDLINELNDTSRLLLDGDGTKKYPGYINSQGKNAVDERLTYETQYQTEYDNLLGKASSDRVKGMVIKQFGAQRKTFLQNVSRHQNGQRIKYEDSVHTTAVNNLRNLAVGQATYNKDTKTWGNEDTIRQIHAAALRHQMERTGDAKVARALADEERSKAHIQVIEDLLTREGGGVTAKQYFDTHTSEISNQIKNELRVRVENGSRAHVSQTFVDDAIQKETDKIPIKPLRTIMKDVNWQREVHKQIGRKFSGETETAVRAEFDKRIARFNTQENSLDADAAYKASLFMASNPDKRLLDFLTDPANKAEAQRIMSDSTMLGNLARLEQTVGRARSAAEYATRDDPETVKIFKPENMTDDKLRQVTSEQMQEYKKLLTEDTWEKIDARRDKAITEWEAQENPEKQKPYSAMEKQIKDIASATKMFDFGTGATGKTSKKVIAARNRARVLKEEMKAWMKGYRERNNDNPKGKEVTAEIVRRTARIVSDPPDTGEPFMGMVKTEREGEEEIKGLIIDIRSQMSPQQRANARVPYDRLRPIFRNIIRENIRRFAPPARQPAMLRDNDLFEKIAGATAVGDKPRLMRLLEIQQ